MQDLSIFCYFTEVHVSYLVTQCTWLMNAPHTFLPNSRAGPKQDSYGLEPLESCISGFIPVSSKYSAQASAISGVNHGSRCLRSPLVSLPVTSYGGLVSLCLYAFLIIVSACPKVYRPNVSISSRCLKTAMTVCTSRQCGKHCVFI